MIAWLAGSQVCRPREAVVIYHMYLFVGFDALREKVKVQSNSWGLCEFFSTVVRRKKKERL